MASLYTSVFKPCSSVAWVWSPLHKCLHLPHHTSEQTVQKQPDDSLASSVWPRAPQSLGILILSISVNSARGRLTDTRTLKHGSEWTTVSLIQSTLLFEDKADRCRSHALTELGAEFTSHCCSLSTLLEKPICPELPRPFYRHCFLQY